MIGARYPERRISLHSFPADEDVLQRFVERMAHMELTGYVGRRNNYSIRFFLLIDFGMKIIFFKPKCICPVLNECRIINLLKLF